MCSRLKLIIILIVTVCLVFVITKKVKARHGPTGMSFNDTTNCTEFSKFGRFHPYSVLNEKWIVFYYWAPVQSLTYFVFTYPTANHTRHLKRILDGNCVLPVMWSARLLLMEDNRKYLSLLVERGDRGEYWLYPVGRVKRPQKITPRDVRLKQTGDNRLIGLMDCAEKTLLAMTRVNDVPRKGKLHEAAARLGYRGRRGRSYLYQGHEWGPVGEADEEMFWDYKETISQDTPKEYKSSERSSEEVEPPPTNKPEHSEEKKSETERTTRVLPPIDENDETCVVGLPELWNDPKPNPKPNPNLITKEELENGLDENNTLNIEATAKNTPNQKESKLEKESANTLKNEKLDNHQHVHKMKMPLKNNLESYTENPDLEEEENCVVCYKSTQTVIPTDEPYRSPNSRSITKLKYNVEVPPTEVPRAEIPHVEETGGEKLHTEVPHAQESPAEEPSAKKPHTVESLTQKLHAEEPRTEELHTEEPRAEESKSEKVHVEVPRSQEPPVEETSDKKSHTEKSRTKMLHTEVPGAEKLRAKELQIKVPRMEVPHAEEQRTEKLHSEVPPAHKPHAKDLDIEVPRTKERRAKKSPARVSAGSRVPQDKNDSSRIVILSPRSLDDLKS